MFTVSVTTFNGEEKIWNVVNQDLATTYFKALCKAIDVAYVYVISGLTGEVFACYSKEKDETTIRYGEWEA